MCSHGDCGFIARNYVKYQDHMKEMHDTKPPETRRRYKVRFKCMVLMELRELEIKCGLRCKDTGKKFESEKKRRPGIQQALSKNHDINPSLITRWKNQEWALLEAAKAPKQRGKEALAHQEPHVRYLYEELKLYERFLYQREVLGLRVDGLWLRIEFMKLLEDSQPPDWMLFKYSSGWLYGFCQRWEITDQAQTNKKHVPMAVKLPLLREFHLEMLQTQIDLMCEGVCGCCDPTFGRFGPLRMFHADQIPMELAKKIMRSLNPKGEGCWMFQPGSGLDKRQATIMLCLRAGGVQVVKICVILRGQGHLSEAELDEIRRIKRGLGNIRFYFQTNAWADGEFMTWWLKKFVKDLKAAGILPDGPVSGKPLVLLGLDRHGAQKTCKFLYDSRDNGVLPFYTPPDCTDCVSPCDHHVGKWLKTEIGKSYLAAVIEKRQTWAVSGIGAQEKRCLMIRWLGEAWNKLREDSAFIRSTFTSTGFLMALEQPNLLIKLEKTQDYDIFGK